MAVNKPFGGSRRFKTTRIDFPFRVIALTSLLFLLIFSLSGCVTLNDPEASQEYNSDSIGVIDANSSLGQTFLSRRPRLNGITIWLTTKLPQSINASSSTINIKLDLFHSVGDPTPLFSTSIAVPPSADHGAVSIPIPVQDNPAGQAFYIKLYTADGSIQLNGRLEDAYPHGQAYSNGSPINADIAFRLSYDYGLGAFTGDLLNYFGNIWLVFPILILLWLPGWLLIDISRLRLRFDLIEQTGMSIGLSLALIPVVMLWTTVLKLHWSRSSVYVAMSLIVIVFLGRLVYGVLHARKLNHGENHIKPDHGERSTSRLLDLVTSHSFLLILIFIGSLLIRLIMVRDLATPAWVDSVHHALITRLILQQGSYSATYLPYLNFSSVAYHPGFHSIAAFFTWLSALDLDRSLLILGQVLNAFTIIAVYLLAKTLTRSATTGLFAAFITGFLTPMPAYYTSWGRYTELTGLLIFPVVLAFIQSWLDHSEDKRSAWIVLLAAIAAGGLFMIHYRVIVFLACLLVAYLIVQLLNHRHGPGSGVLHLLLLILCVTAVCILIVLPWFLPTLRNILLPNLVAPVQNSAAPFADISWPYLTSAYGRQALVLAGLGLIWSLIKKWSLAVLILLWCAILFFFANVGSFHLPGSGLVTNLSVEIILFIPIAILAGYFIEQLLLAWKLVIPARFSLVLPLLAGILLCFVAFQGARQLIPIVNPVTILSRQADLPAIEWINEHLPENETFAINPFPWGYGLYAGNDGGYWIEPLSGRFTLPPPVLYGLGPGYKAISQQSKQVINLSTDPAALHDYLLSQGIHFVFIGARGGVLPPEKLAASGLFEPLYHQDGAWILAVKP